MVTIAELKEVLGIDPEDISQDHYLQSLIRRASYRISSACNRRIEYGELIEYFRGSESIDSRMLYLKNWPVWEIIQLQLFSSISGEYEDMITGFGDTIANSVYIYEGRNAGLIRLLKNYTFGCNSQDKCGQDYRIKYRAGYKNILGTGTVSGKAGTGEISGEGTLFKSEFRIGDRIVTGNYEYVITEILTDTNMNISTNLESSFTEESFRICNVPADLAEAVLMLAAGSYLLRKFEAYGMDQKTENILSVSYNEIQQIIESSNLVPNVKMRFREFDFRGVVESYRRVNI